MNVLIKSNRVSFLLFWHSFIYFGLAATFRKRSTQTSILMTAIFVGQPMAFPKYGKNKNFCLQLLSTFWSIFVIFWLPILIWFFLNFMTVLFNNFGKNTFWLFCIIVSKMFFFMIFCVMKGKPNIYHISLWCLQGC